MSSDLSSGRLRPQVPLAVLLPVLALTAIGLLNLYSATAPMGDLGALLWKKQLLWTAVGAGICGVMMAFDYRLLERLAYPLYVVTILLLIIVLIRGRMAMGAARWIDLGLFRLQPSEPAKLVAIIALARHYQNHWRDQGYGGLEILPPIALLAIPTLLVFLQPDLGTASLMGMIGGSILLFAKIRRRTLLLLICGSMLIAGLGYEYGLKPYQKKRIESFLHPEADRLGSGYHVIQSKIAIGSSGLMGKGFKQGTQSQLNFIPEQHTDFVFAVFAEEWGFVGVTATAVIFLWLIFSAMATAGEAKDTFGILLAVGCAGYLCLSVFINLGMITGLLPVVGAPLPFFSYGGSATITDFAAVGLLANVRMRRIYF